MHSKNLQKSEINHFAKKNTALPQTQNGKSGMGRQLTQVESSQSIRTSPVKNDTMGPKHYPQSIQKASTHKTQKIKIGMHKKAVSLMGSSHTSQISNLQNNEHSLFDFNKQTNNLANINLKQSYIPSSQTSFNDYSSANNNNNNYGEVKLLPKVDNFLMTDKQGSLLTAQQQLQVKHFQKIMHESQLSQPTFDQITGTQDINIKSFDQKPPINQAMSTHQSQRLSLVSDAPQQQPQHLINRQHANSFKSSHQNIAMKHPPNKYIKGNGTTIATAAGSANTTSANLNYSQGGGTVNMNPQTKSKKTLQYSHQRTFSDNPTSFTNSNTQLFNANATSQVSNRKFQELIKSVNKDQLNDNFINSGGLSSMNNYTQVNYPHAMTSTLNNGTGMNAAKTTIGSSRQSAQSQAQNEDRDNTGYHFKGHMLSHDQVPDINQIYSGQFKEQILKTKQSLKLTQQQFGGPSRKVVQNNRINVNSNTQSYRMPTQQSLTGGQVSKMTFNVNDSKHTPKLSVHKLGKTSVNQSQNGTSHGARTTHNATQLTGSQHLMQNEKNKKPTKQLKKKTIDAHHGLNTIANINFHQGNADINMQAIQSTTGKSFHKTGINSSMNGHKRSVSDGNSAVFQSISNRAQINQNTMNSYNKGSKQDQSSLTQNLNMGHPQNEIIKSGSYSKQESKKELATNEYNPKQVVSNEYQIISDRHSYNQSLVVQPNNNVLIHSHRKIGNEGKHFRHNSDQISLQNDKHGKQDSQQQNSTRMATQNKQTIKIKKSQREIGSAGELSSNNEMIIQDQGINQISLTQIRQQNHLKDLQKVTGGTPIKNNLEIKSNIFYKQSSQPSQTQLKPVEERIETQESAASDHNLTPRSRMNVKINRKIRFAFQRASSPTNANFQTTTEFYKIGKVMGKGAFGKVNLAIHRLSNKFVALKSINKQFLSEEASKKKVMQEFNILRRTRHYNVVRLYESFETAQHIVFVMEVCGAGDLLTYVRRRRKLKEDVAKHMFKQIIEGLRYCHSKNILHRDIKLDNILLTSEGDIKICDFGVSKLVRPGEIMTEQCGTPAYIAPEVFENKGYEGYASDVWSSGVVLYAMLYGTVPFKANNMTELQKQITKCQTSFKDEISVESISLLKGILERDPSKRLKISEILKHPWMQDIPEKVTVFTEQEKDKVISEFAYYNFKSDLNNDGGEVIHTDPFTEQMLNSTQNSLIKNASTKSVILAPFNSTRSHIDDDFHLKKSIQDLIIDKKNIKYAAKVKEIDRQYEANNNAELDNGVYHQDSEEEKKEEELEQLKKKNKKGSLEISFDNNDEYGLNEEAKKKQSEWQRLEQQMIDRQKTEEEEEEENYHKQRLLNLGSSKTLVIEEKLVSEIEKSGFPKQYVVNSLNNDDLNYVTTFYYLLTTEKEY